MRLCTVLGGSPVPETGLQRTNGLWFCERQLGSQVYKEGEKNRCKPSAALVFLDSHCPSVLSLNRWLLLRYNSCGSHGIKICRWTSAPEQHHYVLEQDGSVLKCKGCSSSLQSRLFALSRSFLSKRVPVPRDCISETVQDTFFLIRSDISECIVRCQEPKAFRTTDGCFHQLQVGLSSRPVTLAGLQVPVYIPNVLRCHRQDTPKLDWNIVSELNRDRTDRLGRRYPSEHLGCHGIPLHHSNHIISGSSTSN